MRTTVGSSRRVGVCAARNRATPTRIERRLLRVLGPRRRLTHAGLDRLEPVELGVFDEQRATERGDQLGAGTAGLQEAVRLVAGLVDHALRFEALGESRRDCRVSACGRRAAGTLRNRSR